MAPPESPQPYPAMTTVPRYLTGKKEEIKEFLDKFDVSLTSPTRSNGMHFVRLILVKRLIVSIRYFCSIAMVRAALLRSLILRATCMMIPPIPDPID
jgi:hypothetical protein